VNSIFYQNRTGCQWAYLPHDLPRSPRRTTTSRCGATTALLRRSTTCCAARPGKGRPHRGPERDHPGHPVDPRGQSCSSCHDRRRRGQELFEMRRLATVLWARRRASELSQTALGELVGVSRITVHKWEAVRVFPRASSLVTWCGVLDCSLGLRHSESASPPERS